MANAARTKRVTDLLNAISDLKTGDLEAVLDCNSFGTSLVSGADVSTGNRPASGRRLANILQAQLHAIMTMGECDLPSFQKDRRVRSELGGRHW
jgi:hypothetical protein